MSKVKLRFPLFIVIVFLFSSISPEVSEKYPAITPDPFTIEEPQGKKRKRRRR